MVYIYIYIYFVKLPPRDLNPSPYPPHPTSTYICRVTIASRVCSGMVNYIYLKRTLSKLDI